MRLHKSSRFFSSVVAGVTICSNALNADGLSERGHVSRGVVEQLAFDVLLKGKKSEQVVKRDGPISVLATDTTGQHRDLVEDAIADINDAFGYGKLALQWRDEVRAPNEDEIVFLLGSVSDGRLLIERAGVSSPGSFRSGSFRYWYKSHIHRSLTKGLVAIDDSLPDEEICLLARKYLLSVLGFRGSAPSLRQNESFFTLDRASNRTQIGEDSKRWKMLTEADSTMLIFADRWVAASMTWSKIREVFDSKWSDSAESFRTPGMSKVENRASDEALGKVTNTPSHPDQSESSSYSDVPTKRDAVLTCDVLISMGIEKDETASVRIPKGSKGRIVEEQHDQVLLFLGSDRLIYVPKEAVHADVESVPREIKVGLLKPSDSSERIAANGMLEKRFKLNVNQLRLFRGSSGVKMSPKEVFAQAGLRLPEGSAVALTSPSELMVRTTPTMMALVKAVMDGAARSY